MIVLPENILRCLSPDERQKLGKAGMTQAEAEGQAEAKNERELQRQIAQYLDLKELPYFWQRTDCKSTARPGTPDFIVCAKGMFVAIEAKSRRGNCTPTQNQFLSQIMDNQGKVIIARRLTEVTGAFSIFSL